MGTSASVIDLREDSKLQAAVDRDVGRIVLTLLGNGGADVVLLALTAGGATSLLTEVEGLLPELTGEAVPCRRCRGTGDLWLPVARGAVTRTACPCGG